MRVEDAVLFTIGVLGGVRGVTRLHKIIFLAKEEGGVDIDAEFIPYYYGPWSPDVQRAINLLVEKRLVEVMESSNLHGGGSPPKIYVLTHDGRVMLKEILNNVDRKELLKLKIIVSRYGFMPITYLLAYIYSKYPEYSKLSIIRDKVEEWKKFYRLRFGG